jgi:hypothetical protein
LFLETKISFLPRGIDFSPMTRGLLEVFYKTKLGQMGETEFARRLAVLDKFRSQAHLPMPNFDGAGPEGEGRMPSDH